MVAGSSLLVTIVLIASAQFFFSSSDVWDDFDPSILAGEPEQNECSALESRDDCLSLRDHCSWFGEKEVGTLAAHWKIDPPL